MRKIRHLLPGFGLIPRNLETDSMSGIVAVAYQLAQFQGRRGDQTELVGLGQPLNPNTPPPPAPEGLRLNIIKAWKFARLGPYDYRVFAPMAARLQFAPPADICHTHANPYHLPLGKARRRVLHFHTPIEQVPPAFGRALQRADAVICCSTFIQKRFSAAVPAYPADRIYTTANGINLERFTPAGRAEQRAALGIGHEEKVLVYAGQINEEKGLIYVIEALQKMRDMPVRLVIAGSSKIWGGAASTGDTGLSPYEKKVHEAAQGLNVTFLGKVGYARMPLIHKLADGFVLPSVWEEPLGQVALEAMATGVPTVASHIGGIPDIVFEGETGFLVPPRDSEAFAAKLRLLLGDDALRHKMSENCLRRVKEFDAPVVAARIDAIYDTLLANG